MHCTDGDLSESVKVLLAFLQVENTVNRRHVIEQLPAQLVILTGTVVNKLFVFPDLQLCFVRSISLPANANESVRVLQLFERFVQCPFIDKSTLARVCLVSSTELPELLLKTLVQQRYSIQNTNL